MKILILVVLFISINITAQDKIVSFIKETATIYSAPDAKKTTDRTIPVLTEVNITGCINGFFEIEGYGFVRRFNVNQNENVVKLNYRSAPDQFKTLNDSIPTFTKNNSILYSKPEDDAYTDEVIPSMTDIIITEQLNGYYKVYAYGYLRKFDVNLNEELELFNQGLNKKARRLYFDDLERTKKIAEETRIKYIIKKYGKKDGQRILDGKVWIGMTKEQALDSWGSPEDINRTITSDITHEQWVYPYGTYLYFDNGKLTGIQD